MNSKKIWNEGAWWVRILLCFFLVCGFWGGHSVSAAQQKKTLTVDATFAPVDNPLKGFMPYYDQETSFPHSLEWFYVPMKDLMNGENSFTLASGLEPILAEVASRGHQAVFRVYLDYPEEETGVPQFLLDGGLTGHSYTDYGGGWSPDYGDENLINAVTALIAKMGKVYNGDPRIAFITMGFLGFWGEWHTYPHDEWFADAATQKKVIKAMYEAFPDTHLLLRYPPYHLDDYPTGYHDDSFAYDTLPTEDYHFMSLMDEAGETAAWKAYPIGGEVYPDLQEDIFDDTPPTDAEDFSTCIQQTHVSWLLDYTLLDEYSSWSSAKQKRAVEAAREMGYTLAVSEVSDELVSSTLHVTCTFVNLGVAPFYYAWPVSLVLVDSNDKVVLRVTTSWDLRTILPGTDSSTTFTQSLNLAGVASGTYRLALLVENPMSGGKPLLFANAEQQSSGILLLDTVDLDSADHGGAMLPIGALMMLTLH